MNDIIEFIGALVAWGLATLAVFLLVTGLVDFLQQVFPGRRARKRDAEITRQLRHDRSVKKAEALDHELDLFGEWRYKDFDKYKGMLDHSESCPVCRDLPVMGKFKTSPSRGT